MTHRLKLLSTAIGPGRPATEKLAGVAGRSVSARNTRIVPISAAALPRPKLAHEQQRGTGRIPTDGHATDPGGVRPARRRDRRCQRREVGVHAVDAVPAGQLAVRVAVLARVVERRAVAGQRTLIHAVAQRER